MTAAAQDNPVRLLWTAGWDSTFRLLAALLIHRKTVQPYYLVDPNRTSSADEQRAMRRIANALRRKSPDAADRVLPTIVHSVSDVAPDPDLTARFERLRARAHLGGQYDWLARFAGQHGLSDLELSVERSAHGGAADFLRPHVARHDNHGDPYYALRPDIRATDPDLCLFERFRFPLLDTTKREMAAIARDHGFDDLLELTWFCYFPTPSGEPCGSCNPCRFTIAEGLARRIPLKNRLRYHRKKMVGRIRRPLGAAARWAGFRR